MGKSVTEILDMVEAVSDREDAAGVAARFIDQLSDKKGTDLLLARLDTRREELRKWKGMIHLMEQSRNRMAGAVRSQLEEATQLVLAAEDLEDLAEVVEKHPIIFTGNFLNALVQLQAKAAAEGEEFTAKLVQNRLGHLQLIQLAQVSGFTINKANLRDLVVDLVEAQSFSEVLGLIKDKPVVLGDAFDRVFMSLNDAAESMKRDKLEKVTGLRVAVFRALRQVVAVVVGQKASSEGPESAIKALDEAGDAEQFLLAVAKHPFVLGEDFAKIAADQVERCRTDGDEKAAQGLERRMGHLQCIGQIVHNLTSAG